MFRLLLLILCIFVSSCITPDTNIHDNEIEEVTLIDLDFDDESIEPWESQYSSITNFSIINKDDFSNDKCGMFTILEGGDYWTSPYTGLQTARSEIQLLNTSKINETCLYLWDIKIDQNYVESDDWQVIGQFHDQPDETIGENWSTYPAHSPPISYKYKNSELIISVYSWSENKVVDIAKHQIEKNAWLSIKSKIFWSKDNDGTLEVWINDESVLAPNGNSKYIGRNCFNNAGNYIKIGLYRSDTINTLGKVYYDNIKSLIIN